MERFSWAPLSLSANANRARIVRASVSQDRLSRLGFEKPRRTKAPRSVAVRKSRASKRKAHILFPPSSPLLPILEVDFSDSDSESDTSFEGSAEAALGSSVILSPDWALFSSTDNLKHCPGIGLAPSSEDYFSSPGSIRSPSPPLTPQENSFHNTLPVIVTSSASGHVGSAMSDIAEIETVPYAESGLAQRRGFKGSPLFAPAMKKKSSFHTLTDMLSPRTPDSSGLGFSTFRRTPTPRTSKSFLIEPEALPQHIQDDYDATDPFATDSYPYQAIESSSVVDYTDISIYTTVGNYAFDMSRRKTSRAVARSASTIRKQFAMQTSTNIYDLSIYDFCLDQGAPLSSNAAKSDARERPRSKSTASRAIPRRPSAVMSVSAVPTAACPIIQEVPESVSQECATPFMEKGIDDLLAAIEGMQTPQDRPDSPTDFYLFPTATRCVSPESIDPQVGVLSPPTSPIPVAIGVCYEPEPSKPTGYHLPVAPAPARPAPRRATTLRPLILPMHVARRESSFGGPEPETKRASLVSASVAAQSSAETKAAALGDIITLLGLEETPPADVSCDSTSSRWSGASLIGLYTS